jgi:hypothetical protein
LAVNYYLLLCIVLLQIQPVPCIQPVLIA